MIADALETPLTISADFAPEVWRDLIIDPVGDDEFIILHPTQARWAWTNRAGLQLAKRFDGTLSLAAAIDELVGRHGAQNRGVFERDIRAFAQLLYETNLIENLPLAPEHEKVKVEAPVESDMRKDDEKMDLSIFITEQCNLRCKHCGYVEGKMYDHDLSVAEIQRIIDQHLALFPGSTVSFSGGEVTLRDDCLELLEYACARTPKVNFNTNGLLLTPEMAARLAKTHSWVQISLDGADAEMHNFIRGKGMFERAWRAVEMLAAAGAHKQIIIACTLTQGSIKQVQEMVARADALGIRLLRFLTLNKQRAALTHWDRIAPSHAQMLEIYRYLLLDLPRQDRHGKTDVECGFPGFVPDASPKGDSWCPLGQMVLIDSLGNAYNCPTLNFDSHKTGSIKDSSIEEIYNGEKNRTLRQQMLNRRYVIEECRSCAWRNFCQGGCSAFTYLRTNSMFVNDEFCDFRRDLYRDFARMAANGAASGVSNTEKSDDNDTVKK